MSELAQRAEIPLTQNQKLRLLAGCIPAIGFLVFLGAYLAIAASGSVPFPSTLLWIVIAAVCLALGSQAALRLRDIALGVALVEQDVMIRSWHAAGNNTDLYGKFQRLGILKLGPKVQAPNAGGLFRVTHSPASKIVWDLVLLDPHHF